MMQKCAFKMRVLLGFLLFSSVFSAVFMLKMMDSAGTQATRYCFFNIKTRIVRGILI